MTEIKMPSAGQTTDEATIVAVHVKVGDTIKRGDVLCEAETDKAVLPVESFAAGTALAVLVHEGDTVTAGRLGTKTVEEYYDGGTQVLLGEPLRFTKDNIDEWKTQF